VTDKFVKLELCESIEHLHIGVAVLRWRCWAFSLYPD